ncbi:MAG TPA: polysaccharide biosynthesis/export family protein [Bryobacteraceae bacterium]|nr:polysaccharide biosynthesis/export family protein [Bryobacteraceae bacterium]
MSRWQYIAFVFCTTAAMAQVPVPAQTQPSGQTPAQPGAPSQNAPGVQQPRELPPDSIRPNYVLGPNDQILIRTQAEEINEKPFRIDADGNINLPLLGRVHAGGMTVQELESDLTQRLREYIREPQVIIQVTQFRSSPVFFVGAFKSPGIYPLQGNRTLVEMLTQIGGTQPNASQRITITRRAEYGPIPLPSAVEDPEKKISTVEISLASLRQNVNPAEDILLQPYDVVSAERAEQIYVTGEVLKTGPLEMGERESISIAQVLTMAGGFSRDALKGKVRILRPIVGTTRRAAIEVDVKRIFEGKDNDVPLLPNDILYVPRSYTRLFWQTFGQITLPMLPYVIFILSQ